MVALHVLVGVQPLISPMTGGEGEVTHHVSERKSVPAAKWYLNQSNCLRKVHKCEKVDR